MDQQNKLDLEGIAKGIVNDNEIGDMFFSIVNQKYDSYVSKLLCDTLRNNTSYKDLLTIFKNTKCSTLDELVTKSCNEILKTFDKMLMKIHNIIINGNISKESD